MLLGKTTSLTLSLRSHQLCWLGCVALAVACLGSSAQRGVAAEKAPEFSDFSQLVEQHFAKKANYKPGDLITRGDVSSLLSQLDKLGLKLEGGERDFDVFVPDSHVLVQLLRTPQGRKLMRRINHLPQIYDRMEKLAGFADGQQLLVKMTSDYFTALQYSNESADAKQKAPISIKAFEALCSAETAQQLEWDYPTEPACQNFAVPTGHVYTQESLLAYIKTVDKLATLKLSRPGD